MDLKKAPSVSETLDWARTLVLLGVSRVGSVEAVATLNVLLKHRADIERATRELTSAGAPAGAPSRT
jgi:hypothetical protein